MILNAKQIIINADDLGISPQVNAAALALMHSSLVTSATIMVNGPCWSEAVEWARSMPYISFGVHLNVSEGYPLTDPRPLGPLVDGAGRFQKLRDYRRLPCTVMRAVFQELCIQVERLMAAGITVSHLDSHHHLHTQPRFFGILKRIQSRFRIRKVRISKNIYRPSQRLRSPLLLHRKALWNLALRHLYGTRTTEGFTDFLTFVEIIPHHRLLHDSLEIGVHPGNEKYADETALLASWNPNCLSFPIRLINYHDL